MKPYVSFCGRFIMLKNIPVTLYRKIKNLGFCYKLLYGFVYEHVSEEDKIRVFSELNDLGFLFSVGKEWSPAEQVEYYKEKGLLQGVFKIIYWTNKKEFRIKEV